MMRWLVLLLIALLPASALAEEAIPRTLIAVYDSKDEYSPRYTFPHRFMEFPANHLGYDFHYQDIHKPMQKLTPDVAGILVWLSTGIDVPDPMPYLNWLREAQLQGKKLIVLENIGITEKNRKNPEIAAKLAEIMGGLGLRDDNSWYPLTYEARILSQDKSIVGFERNYGPTLSPFSGVRTLPGRATTHLRVAPGGDDDEPVDLVVTSPTGGFVAEGYAFFIQDTEDPRIMQWYINPFAFLKAALATPFAPTPDVSTLDGRRIFYSQIDGDGWNNISEIPKYSKTNTLSAEVIRKELLEPSKDFPFSVGLITADVDTDCFGVDASEAVARAIYQLPNVEPSSHTHSHPLFWRFFRHYTPQKEERYLKFYPARPVAGRSVTDAIKSQFDSSFSKGGGTGSKHTDAETVKLSAGDEADEKMLAEYYTTPRSYACQPFDLDDEITGSAKRITQLIPPEKKVRLVQWSGDTSPFEQALAKTREAGFWNINGGDSRFDKEYPSYAWVSPIGLRVGNERQIYSSNSNENTYTNLWTGRFFGFRYLQTTLENTEHPVRVHPINLYFHIFSGQKQASLDAVKDNLEYVRKQHIIPITTSHYAAIANGFYAAQIIPAGKDRWEIQNRGEMNSFRFDNADAYDVNMGESRGLLGFNHYQGSLYVAVDPDAPNPIIQLSNNDKKADPNPIPYLIESRWPIKSLLIGKKSLTFSTNGYGKGAMVWHVSPEVEYVVSATREQKSVFNAKFKADKDGNLALDFGDMDGIQPATVTIEQIH